MKPTGKAKCRFCGALILYFDREMTTMHEAPLCDGYAALMRSIGGPGYRESMHTVDPVTGEATEIGPPRGSA